MGAKESMAVRSEEIVAENGHARKRPDNKCVATSNEVIAFLSPAQWKNQFEAAKDSNQLMVIDFTATWCGSCRFIEPYVKEFAPKYPDVIFIKIDVDELPMVAAEFGAQALPAFVLVKKGVAVDRVVGTKVDELRMKVEKHSSQTQNFTF